ncbi:MAG TPA: response regulator [Rhizomicrobium sp.]|nr:response regulator [Rhizomicrobium sp.]
MTVSVCFIAAGDSDRDRIGSMLSRCGVALWTVRSPEAYCADPRRMDALCIVIDMPGQSGLEALERLRSRGIRSPAILIGNADSAGSEARLIRACVLDVLRKPIDATELLGWIECVCATRMVLEKRRAA